MPQSSGRLLFLAAFERAAPKFEKPSFLIVRFQFHFKKHLLQPLLISISAEKLCHLASDSQFSKLDASFHKTGWYKS